MALCVTMASVLAEKIYDQSEDLLLFFCKIHPDFAFIIGCQSGGRLVVDVGLLQHDGYWSS